MPCSVSLILVLTLAVAALCVHSISLDGKETAVKQTTDQNGKCEEITVPMCRNMEYNMTSMPNQFNHESQTEAAMEVNSNLRKCFSFLK